MYYIGMDVHKKTIHYCVKDVSGRVHQEGKLGASRCELDAWMKTLAQPWTVVMEATIFTGWIYDHLSPHAAHIKVTGNSSCEKVNAHAIQSKDEALGKKRAAKRTARRAVTNK